MIIRTLAVGLLLATGLAGAAAAQDGKSTWQRVMDTKVLRVGFAVGEPYAFKDITGSDAPGFVKAGPDVWRGIGPLLGKKIADALGVRLEPIESAHAASVAALQANQIDLFLPVQATPARAKAADFVPTPVMWFAMSFYARSDNPPTKWAEINDPKVKIGVVLGAHTDSFATEKLPKAQINRFPDINSQIAAFQAGRVDAIVALGPVAQAAYAKIKRGTIVTPTPYDVSATQVAVQQEADQRWRNYLTTTIQYYYNAGEIQQIYEGFLTFRGIDPATVLPIERENWPRQ